MALRNIGKVKADARAEALRRIKALQSSSLKNEQQDFDFNLSSFLQRQKGCWSAYRSLPGEASPEISIKNNNHIQWAFPKVIGKTLQFFLQPKTWVKGAFGMDEPEVAGSESIAINKLDACLIPGLAFDHYGTRLGRGFGYFDRALEGFTGLKVGLTFKSQMWGGQELPRESFDIPMDVIITEKEVIVIHQHPNLNSNPNQVVKGEHRNG